MSEGRSRNRAAVFIRAFAVAYWRSEIPVRSAGISYFVFFALLPILTAAISVAIALPFWRSEAERALLLLTQWLLPDAIYEVGENLRTLAQNATGISAIGVGVAIYVLIKVTFYFERSLNAIWRFETGKSALALLKKALKLALLLIVLLVAIMGTTQMARLSAILEFTGTCLFFVAFNKVVPNGHTSWRQAIPGGVFGGTAWQLTKWGFTTYLQHFAKAEQIYALLGIVPLFLLWLYVSVMILLMSACLNFALASSSAESEPPVTSPPPARYRWPRGSADRRAP